MSLRKNDDPFDQLRIFFESARIRKNLSRVLTEVELDYLFAPPDAEDIETAEPLPFMDEDSEDLAVLERRCAEYFPQDRDMHGRQP